jgi:drug/metabolite transporter (DMT)-like permease
MSFTRASLMLLLAAFLWGAGNVAQKTVLLHIGPISAVGARCLLAALLVAPLVRLEKERFALPRRGDWTLLLAIALSFALATSTYQAAYGYTSVMNSGFIVNLCCVATPLIAWIILRLRPPVMAIPSILCAMLGVFLIGGGTIEAFSRGDFLALLAAFFYAAWAVFLGIYLSRSSRPFFLMALKLAATGLMCLGGGVLIEAPHPGQFLAAWRELVFLGIFSTALAYSLQVFAQQYVSATIAMVFVSAEAVFGAVFAHIFLGEDLTLMACAGGLLVIVGIVLISIEGPAWPAKANRRWKNKRPVVPVVQQTEIPLPIIARPALPTLSTHRVLEPDAPNNDVTADGMHLPAPRFLPAYEKQKKRAKHTSQR